MKKSLSQILYGYVFILLDIRIGVDILADPVGYLLIALGCLKLGEKFADGKLAAYIAITMIFLSIPSVFIDFNLVENGSWYYYSNGLFVGELVMTFYLFRLLKLLAEAAGQTDLKDRTQFLYNIYIPASLFMLGLAAFYTATEMRSMEEVFFVLVLILLILNIAFILLLNAFRKAAKEEEALVLDLGEGSKES